MEAFEKNKNVQLALKFHTIECYSLLTDDIQDIKYNGSAATTQIVIRAKDKLKNFIENDKVLADNVANLSSTSRNTSPTFPGNILLSL